MKGRSCIRILLLVCWLSTPAWSASAPVIPVLQGPTNANTTQITLLLPRPNAYKVKITDAKGKAITPYLVDESVGFDTMEVLRTYYLRELSADQSYNLTIQTPKGEKLTERHFKTLQTQAKSLSFAVASCMDDGWVKERVTMWQEMLSQKPDVIFLIGDTVYADRQNKEKIKNLTPLIYWKRFSEVRHNLALFHATDLVPVFSMWDDHDFGGNNSFDDHPWADVSLTVYQRFFPRHPLNGNYSIGPGMAALFEAFGQRFVLLDSRAFRSNDGVTPEKHFGQTQEDWLFNILNAKAMPTWLMSGDQFFGAYSKFDSYEGTHPAAFKNFLERLSKQPSPVMFVSGDRHLTELMKIDAKEFGQDTFELTASGIHVKTHPANWDKKPNPRQIAGADLTHNYSIISVNLDAKPQVQIKAFGPGKKQLFDSAQSVPTKK